MVKLDSIDGNTINQQNSCLERCKSYPGATGCEVIWNQRNRGCYVHTKDISRGNNRKRHLCWVFSKCGKWCFQNAITLVLSACGKWVF